MWLWIIVALILGSGLFFIFKIRSSSDSVDSVESQEEDKDKYGENH